MINEIIKMVKERFNDELKNADVEKFERIFKSSELISEMEEEVKLMMEENISVLIDCNEKEIKSFINEDKLSYDKDLLNKAIFTLDTTIQTAKKFECWMKENDFVFQEMNDKLCKVILLLNNERDWDDFRDFCSFYWEDFENVCKEHCVSIEPTRFSSSRFRLTPDKNDDKFEELSDIYNNNSPYPSYKDYFIGCIVDEKIYPKELPFYEPLEPTKDNKYYSFIEKLLDILLNCKPEYILKTAKEIYTSIKSYNYETKSDIEEFLSNLTINKFLSDIIITYEKIDEKNLEEWKEIFNDVFKVTEYFNSFKDNQVELFSDFRKDKIEEATQNIEDIDGKDNFIINIDDCNILIKSSEVKLVLDALKKYIGKKDASIKDVRDCLNDLSQNYNIDYKFLTSITFNKDDMKNVFDSYRPEMFKIF